MKLDATKLAGGDRIKVNTGILPHLPQKPAGKDTQAPVKEAAPPVSEKAKEEQKKPEVKKEPAKAVQEPKEEAVRKPAEKAAPVAAKTTEKKRRGRPQVRPLQYDEQGQRVINTNVPLTEELQMFLDYCVDQDDSVSSKGAFISKLVQNCYEKNFEEFRVWKKAKNKGIKL